MSVVRYIAFLIGAYLLAVVGFDQSNAGEPSSRTSRGSYGSVRQSPYSSTGYSNSGYSMSGYSAAGLSSKGMRSTGYSSKGISRSTFNNEQFGSVRQSAYHGSSMAGSGDSPSEVSFADEGSGSESGTDSFGDGRADEGPPSGGLLGSTAFSDGNGTYAGSQGIVFRATSASQATASDGTVRFGLIVKNPPAGSVKVNVGEAVYYYSAGYFYNPAYVNGIWNYTVVRPPVGVAVFELPSGCAAQTIGGVNYQTIDGVFYRRAYVNGQVGYVVVASPE